MNTNTRFIAIFDIDKVEAIKAAIAEGRFEIDADAIAEKMMNQDSLLG